MTGLGYETVLANVEEFVYYSFDQPGLKTFFENYWLNSYYYVILVHDRSLSKTHEYLYPIADSLQSYGFRVGFDEDSLFMLLPTMIAEFSDSTTLSTAVEFLNTQSAEMDSVMSFNRPIIIWMGDVNSRSDSMLSKIIGQAYPGEWVKNFRVDLRPLIYRNRPSPYSDIVLVFSEFSDYARSFRYRDYFVSKEGRLMRSNIRREM